MEGRGLSWLYIFGFFDWVQSYICGYFTIEEIEKLYQPSYITKMQSDSVLYSKEAPSKLGRLLLSTSARKQQAGDITVTIYENCLVESSSSGKAYVPFDFDLKFGHVVNPPSVFLQKENSKQTYQLRSGGELQLWRQVLKEKLNQRGFHEQFVPKKKIGKGNFASVYLAQKIENGRNYAVKAFSKQAAYSEDKGKECLIKQIEIMRVLNHRNCMRLHEVFESQNSLYMVVQLLEGGLLHDKVKAKEKFKSHEIKQIILSILNGLKQMHSKKAMHRDLKPENLIFRQQGSCDLVIADFGLAEFSDADEYLFVRCGTPGYVAPEVINIKDMKTKYEPICDMFSLGLIFHILLLGKSAFPGKTYNQVLAQNRASNIPCQGPEYDSLDPNALNLLKRMLKKNQLERISATEALNHIYFTQTMEEQEVDVVPELLKPYPSCESPLLTSANQDRLKQKTIKKDSCVDFKLGRENVFTGKVDTVSDVASTNNSVGKRFESVRSPKASKFSTKK